MARSVALTLILSLALAAHAFAAPIFPALTGRVVDEAQILSPQSEASLGEKLEALEARTQHQFVIVTVRDLQGYDIADYGYQLGRAWGVGRQGENDGVLLLVAPSEREVRIEVGYALEPVLTDALSSVILNTRVLPKFKAGDMEGGVIDGADAVIAQLGMDPAQAQKIAQDAKAQARKDSGFPLWALVVIFFFFVLPMLRVMSRRRRGLDALPWIILGGLSGGGGGRGGGSWGGGGFSGGGGSFGGGGASGRW